MNVQQLHLASLAATRLANDLKDREKLITSIAKAHVVISNYEPFKAALGPGVLRMSLGTKTEAEVEALSETWVSILTIRIEKESKYLTDLGIDLTDILSASKGHNP